MRNDEFSDLSDLSNQSDKTFTPAMMLSLAYGMLLAMPLVSIATWNVRLGSAMADVWMSMFLIAQVSLFMVIISLVAR